MDYTEGTEIEKRRRAKKMMLWFGIVSLSMSFAGLTSAFVVSRKRSDWVENLTIPKFFMYSLVVIIVSSLTMELAKKAVRSGRNNEGTTWLLITWALGVLFIYFQFLGFKEIYLQLGYAFNENISFSFLYIIVLVHIAHLIAAMIALMVVIYNHFKQRYTQGKTLGIELAATFWHFVDFVWIYLFLFFYFFR
ncbi:MAG TPA: cytochrome c oxidase subunit 3 [Flavobacteriaceae bacterium]|nr:heme-copper oxidase subunit III [Flavobacteriaceae bacterium]MCB9212285.1 heme-copper oxidase subunit III [Alteromonas sp.]HPF10336.1 cytochrome c oxidase subunit 3 [Flavobacteriaceae bacterium]HQU20400.1 cytochrome c oxidase subunit 3 [Flavobacteriaceae bacterium]HQU65738.1 cytochrome c oxidase subunit 3 [Flavobacteriaceae bacterium]